MSIYRIISFFELLQTLRSDKLRVSSAARFTDPNEMVGYLFATLASPMWSPGTPEGLKRAQDEINLVRESHYVSCWTHVKDSIAMWEIYSPHQNAVQIEVIEDNIREVFENHCKSAAWFEAHNTPPSWDKTVFYPPKVGDCRYENLEKLAESIKAKTRNAAARATEALSGRDLSEGYEDFHRVYEEANNDREHDHVALFYVKDEAYKHEKEIRFCLHAMRRNGLDYDECKKHPMFSMMDPHIDASTIEQTGPNIYINFPKSIIRHVWLDGRCPAWLISLQTELLAEFGIEATQSKAYGKFSDKYPIDIWWDSHPA